MTVLRFETRIVGSHNLAREMSVLGLNYSRPTPSAGAHRRQLATSSSSRHFF
jgi:hypothetical protein